MKVRYFFEGVSAYLFSAPFAVLYLFWEASSWRAALLFIGALGLFPLLLSAIAAWSLVALYLLELGILYLVLIVLGVAFIWLATRDLEHANFDPISMGD